MVRLYQFVVGQPLDCYEQFTERLKRRLHVRLDGLDVCDFILAFVTITSRVGTDIEAAFKVIPEGKPVMLVVFHHNFDPEYVVPDSSRFIRREDVFLFNMLFHETENGLLRCLYNDQELKRASDWLLQSSPESRPLLDPPHDRNNKFWCYIGTAVGVLGGCAVVGLIVWAIVYNNNN